MSQRLPERFLTFFTSRPMRRVGYGLVGTLLAYSAAGFLVLPGVIKSQAERLAQDKLQRRLVIGTVDVNPFALTVVARDVKMMEKTGDAPFASFETLRLNLSVQSVLRLAPVIQELHLSKPDIQLVRTEAHHYNIDDILVRLAEQPPSDKPARFSINNIQVEDGRIRFDDRPAKAVHTIDKLRLGVPFVSSLPSQVNIFVEPLLAATVNGTPVEFKGKARPFADPKDALLELNFDGLDVTRAVEYLPFKPNFRIPSARLDLHLNASFLQPKGKTPSVKLNGTAALKAFQLTEPDGKQLIKLPAMTVTLHDTDLFGGRYDVARIALDGLEADVARMRDGQLNFARLVSAPADQAAPAKSKSASGSAGLKLALGELDVRGATLRYSDAHAARPLQSGVEKFDLSLRRLAVDTGKRSVDIEDIASDRAGLRFSQEKAQAAQAQAPAQQQGPAKSDKERENGAPYAVSIGRIAIDKWTARVEDRSQPEPVVTDIVPISLSLHNLSTAAPTPATLKLNATVNKSGQLAMNGNIGLAPLHTDLALDVKGVDILPLQPYLTDLINLRLTRANLSGNGKLQLDAASDGALKGGFKGDVTLGNVATVDKTHEKDFLRWKSLYFGGVDMRLAPFALAIDEVALSDFFARVIIDETGRFNLQDIALGQDGARKEQSAAGAHQTAVKKPSATPIKIGKVTLQGGRVRFTDNFIKPNYSATLADFGGVVSNLSSDPSTSAGLNLHAEVNNAPLSVAGRINPLRGDLFLDVKANVRGMELAPLSGYSGRYVGYGIEKGRLSFEVSYLVDQRKLTAENRLVLEQITFGEKIESPTATKLPVLFAVALLRDRNGVIDINLPISGSLDDPEFSVGGIIVRVIGNLIAKAVTQPFALLGSLFSSGGAELSSLEFEPGRAAIPPAGQEKLKSLAKALTERPGLTLDIAGRVDPEADRAGLKRVSVERKVRAVKISDLAARGETPVPGSVVVQPAEYPALLERAYKAEKFPKPRNVLGLPKSVPVEEMEKLMIDNTDVDEDDLVTLGNQRAQAAKNWLIKNGDVPAERMYILAPKIGAPDGQAGSGQISRIDFSLR